MIKYIKWLQHSIGTIIFIISIVAFFNYKVDSLGLFGQASYLLRAAQTLISGQMVAGLSNYDERLFQELIIKNLQVKNDIIAIGSSRTMDLRREFLGNKYKNFFNHSVSSASLEDYIAILGIYEKEHGYLPSKIILGLDDWIFNKYHFEAKWKSIETYYNFEINSMKQQNIKNSKIYFEKWKQLINYDYTLTNIKFFIHSFIHKSNFYITKTTDLDMLIIGTDGSRYYPLKTRNKDKLKIKQSAIQFVKDESVYLNKYTEMTNKILFEKYIKYLQSKGVNVVFYLPPYNPIAYDIITKKYNIINTIEIYMKDFAKKNKIEVYGSYNPHEYNFMYTDFIDGMHSRDVVIKEIFKEIK